MAQDAFGAYAQRMRGGVVNQARDHEMTVPLPTAGDIDNSARQFAKGVPVVGAYLDEANAATRAAMGQGDYESNVAAERQRDKQFEAAHPYGAAGMQIAGGLASGAGLMRAAPGVGNVVFGNLGRGIVPRMAASGIAGAGVGAVHGFGAGEDLDSRITEAKRGGMVGGAIGTVAPPVASGISALARQLTNYGATRSAAQNLNTTPSVVRRLARDIGSDDLTRAGVTQRAAELGPEGMTLDYGRNLTGRAEALAGMPGAAQRNVVGAVEGRVRDTAQRIGAELDNAMGPSPNVVTLMNRIDGVYNAQIRPAYDRVMNAHPQVWDDNLSQLAARPSIAKAMRDAVTLAKEAGDNVSAPFVFGADGTVSLKPGATPNLRYWDYVKKSLDARIGAMVKNPDPNSAGKATLGALLDSKRALVDHLDNLTGGAYQAARNVAADKFTVKEAFETGLDIFKNKMLPEEFAQTLHGAGEIERRAMAAGARRALERMREVAPSNISEGGRQVYRELLQGGPNGDTAQKLRMLLGDDAANDVITAAQRETGFQSVYDRVAGNSRTAPRLNAQADMTPPKVEGATVTGLMNRAPVAAAEKLLGYQFGQGMERTREGLGDVLTRRGPQARNALLELVDYNAATQSNPMTRELAKALLMGPAITQGERAERRYMRGAR